MGKKVRGRGEKADNNYASYTRFLSLSEYILATRVVYNPPVFPCSRWSGIQVLEPVRGSCVKTSRMTGCWNCRSLPSLAKFQRARVFVIVHPLTCACIYVCASWGRTRLIFISVAQRSAHFCLRNIFLPETIRDNKILSSAWRVRGDCIAYFLFLHPGNARLSATYRSSSDALYRARYTSHSVRFYIFEKSF